MADNELDDFGDQAQETAPSPLKRQTGHPDEESVGVDKKKKFNYFQWTNVGDGVYTYAGDSQKTLRPGTYSYFQDNQGRLYLQSQELKTDELLEFEDSLSSTLINEIERFWDSGDKFHQYGFLHKRGYILYGPAGCGKTGIIQLIIQKVVARKGIVIMVNDPDYLVELMRIIRTIEPTRHIVCIAEDLDAIIKKHGEASLLAFLDGENQVDDILTIATTNYPERLDRRIISRPRRFDKRIKVLPPSQNVRRAYFTQKLKLTPDEVEEWVKKTDNFTFAGMTDLVIQVKCLDITLDEAVEIVQKLTQGAVPSSSDGEKKTGFNA